MGFSDRLRAWMRGDRSSRTSRSSERDDASRSATKDLEEFTRSRIGVEAFLEPKTAIYSTTVLLVADDGEYLRRPVKDRDAARRFASEVNIPLYDARQVGYPKRMRDYDQGKRPRRVELSELPPWPGDDPAPPRTADGPPPPPRRSAATEAADQTAPRDDPENDPEVTGHTAASDRTADAEDRAEAEEIGSAAGGNRAPAPDPLPDAAEDESAEPDEDRST